jgi:hypothetical protein
MGCTLPPDATASLRYVLNYRETRISQIPTPKQLCNVRLSFPYALVALSRANVTAVAPDWQILDASKWGYGSEEYVLMF